ncbi:MAG: Gx transporter family protein [Brevinematales bacterium]|nr:Gx transporter family protein [Brevinematales bacterium]
MGLLNDIDEFERLSPEGQEFLVAYLVAVASLLSVVDGWIPKPLPLAKIGLANMVTLVLVLRRRYRLSLVVAFFRVVVSHVLGGTLFTFGFWLSLSGSVVSAFVMSGVHSFFGSFLSVYGVSLWGGWAHALAQGVVAGFFLGFTKGIILYVAFLMMIGIGTSLGLAWLVERYLNPKTKIDQDHQDEKSNPSHNPEEKTSSL